MSLLRCALLGTAVYLSWSVGAAACEARDFLALPLVHNDDGPEARALTLAYPGLAVSSGGASITLADGTVVEFGGVRDVTPAQRLENATLSEQFFHVYPLGFDLEQRTEPFFDPGRIRSDSFFRALYFSNEQDARSSLVEVAGPAGTKASFWMTTSWGVSCQLEAALAEISASQTNFGAYFQEIGGSFNWRQISGTSRLSAHSYGISIDINAQLGQYWKWTGAREGIVGAYNNKVPEGIVRAMERYGFIWGGKWHHFDGMHFEYRPELILHSRIIGLE